MNATSKSANGNNTDRDSDRQGDRQQMGTSDNNEDTPNGAVEDDVDVSLGQLRRAIAGDAPPPELVSTTHGFPDLHFANEIIGEELFDSSDTDAKVGVRFVSAEERDLIYGFSGASVSVRLTPHSFLAQVPTEWDVTEARVQTTSGHVTVEIDEFGVAELFQPFDGPVRLAVICDDAVYCTRWAIP